MHGADWTPELDAEIVRLRRDERLSTPQIASRVGRTTGAVYARFRNIDALIMDRREWAADEVESLVALVEAGELTIRAVAEELGRTETSVRWKLEHLGIKPNRRHDWTPEQLARLREAFTRDPKISNAELAALLGRPESGVGAKVVELALRPPRHWSEADLVKLRAAASLDEAVETIGRDRGSVLAKVYALGIRFPDAVDNAWTEEALAQLRTLIEERGDGGNALASIAAELGRTVRAIQVQARKHAMMAPKRRRRALDAAGRAEIVAAATGGMSITVAAKTLGRDVRILRQVADQAGVAFVAAVRGPVAKPKPAKPMRVPLPVAAPRLVEAVAPAPRAPTQRELKAEMVRLAAASTVPVRRIEAVVVKEPAPRAAPAKPRIVPKAAPRPLEPRVAAPAVRVAPAPVPKPVQAPVPVQAVAPAPAKFVRKPGKSNFGWVAPAPRGKDTGRDAALALSAGMADQVARFLAERGAKRPEADPLEATIAAIRARGYSVIREDGVFVIDARHRLAGSDALFAFAEARGLRVPTAMQAAE